MTADHAIISPKKLIEVALPLDAINVACAREKSIRHGHPSTLHLWWARRPLAAARAVIFSQLVNDPEDLWKCQHPGQEPNAQVKGRVKGAATITVTRNEIMDAFNQGEKFVLAIVLVHEDDRTEGPYYIRRPFDREPGWGVSSINFELKALLERAKGFNA